MDFKSKCGGKLFIKNGDLPLGSLLKELFNFKNELKWAIKVPLGHNHFEAYKEVPECTLNGTSGEDSKPDNDTGKPDSGELTGPGSMEGFVYAEDGVTPISGAKVFIGVGESSKLAASTDEMGHYSCESIPTGVIDMLVQANGYCVYHAAEIVQEEGRTTISPIIMIAEQTDGSGGVIIRFIDALTQRPRD